jgi:trans-2,3-dihydro-3-hydroxyanthranilate isomerase
VNRTNYVLCDVFATGPLSGNQLAVFTQGDSIAEADLGALAREFNFSEVTFVGAARPDGSVPVRIFTQTSEIPFAGHPMLGTAAVTSEGHGRDATLSCGVGSIRVTLDWHDEASAFASMHQPIPTVTEAPVPDALLDALGLEDSVLPIELYDNGMAHVFVALADEVAVARLSPDPGRLAEVAGLYGGVNCFAGSGHRWKTRMFAPGFGVVEDPATGSAAGPLACHLARHGRIAWGTEVEIHQGDEIGRPSLLRAQATGSAGGVTGVRVGGVVNVLGRGELSW